MLEIELLECLPRLAQGQFEESRGDTRRAPVRGRRSSACTWSLPISPAIVWVRLVTTPSSCA
jgi:hypothetical protein